MAGPFVLSTQASSKSTAISRSTPDDEVEPSFNGTKRKPQTTNTSPSPKKIKLFRHDTVSKRSKLSLISWDSPELSPSTSVTAPGTSSSSSSASSILKRIRFVSSKGSLSGFKSTQQTYNDSAWSLSPSYSIIQPPVALVQPPVASIEPLVASVEPPLADTEPTVTSFEPPVASVEPTAASIQPPVASVKPTVTSIQSSVASVQPPVASIQPLVASVEPTVASIQPPAYEFSLNNNNQIFEDALEERAFSEAYSNNQEEITDSKSDADDEPSILDAESDAEKDPEVLQAIPDNRFPSPLPSRLKAEPTSVAEPKMLAYKAWKTLHTKPENVHNSRHIPTMPYKFTHPRHPISNFKLHHAPTTCVHLNIPTSFHEKYNASNLVAHHGGSILGIGNKDNKLPNWEKKKRAEVARRWLWEQAGQQRLKSVKGREDYIERRLEDLGRGKDDEEFWRKLGFYKKMVMERRRARWAWGLEGRVRAAKREEVVKKVVDVYQFIFTREGMVRC